MFCKHLIIVTLAAAGILLSATGALAYVDPGVGGMFYQILLLVGATVAGFLAAFRSKISAYFARKKGQAGDNNEHSGE